MTVWFISLFVHLKQDLIYGICVWKIKHRFNYLNLVLVKIGGNRGISKGIWQVSEQNDI